MEELVQSPTVSSSFEDPLMSKRTTPSAPASELGNLNIGSSSSGGGNTSMPVTTRAMYRTYAAPRDTPSRTTAGPSRPSQRSGQARSGAAGRRAPSNRAVAPAAAAEASGESGAQESDDDDDESDDEEQDQRASGSPTGDALIRLSVLETFALSEPNYLTGLELLRANGGSPESTQVHCRLAFAVAEQALASPAFATSLQTAVPVPSSLYSRLMLDRMSLRLTEIWLQLSSNIRNASYGADVITTAASLRRLTVAIDSLTRPRHWNVATAETRRAYCSLLLNMLVEVVQADSDAYAAAPRTQRPAYAGQRAEHTNLYLCLIGNPPEGEDPAFVAGLLRRLDPDGALLAGSAVAVERVHQIVLDRHSVQAADGGRTSRGHPQPRNGFVLALRQLRNAVVAQAQAH